MVPPGCIGNDTAEQREGELAQAEAVWDGTDPIAAAALVQRQFAELRSEHLELRTDHAALAARVQDLESRLTDGDAALTVAPRAVAAADVILNLVTTPGPNAGFGDEKAGSSRRAGARRSSRIVDVIKMISVKEDQEEAKFTLADSMWDASMFLCSKHTAGVGWLVSFWAVVVFVLNIAVQATIVFVVVYRMAENADIDDDTVADLRCAYAQLRSGHERAQRWRAPFAGSIARTSGTTSTT
jgi:hypothetical protein